MSTSKARGQIATRMSLDWTYDKGMRKARQNEDFKELPSREQLPSREHEQGGRPSAWTYMRVETINLKCQIHTWCNYLYKRKFSSSVNCSTAYIYSGTVKSHFPSCNSTSKHEFNHCLFMDLLTLNTFTEMEVENNWSTRV